MQLGDLIKLALEEDLGSGDITSQYLDLGPVVSQAIMVAKAPGILAGVEVARQVFKTVDPDLRVTIYRKDGDMVQPKDEIMSIEGKAAGILMAERVALNFIQRMSGIATQTRELVDALQGTDTKVLDTRKTTPLLRSLEKYAVRVGGGFNHRFGLYDMVMLKENHIRAAGGISAAMQQIKKHNTSYKVEVEVTNLEELAEAVEAGADRVMLDNMTLPMIRTAARKYRKKVELEISGGVTATNIAKYARAGVHYISSGSITHSYKSLDISLLFEE